MAGMLALAQTLLAAHGVEHLSHSDQEACEVCLTGVPLGAALGTTTLTIPAWVTAPLPLPNALTRLGLRALFNPHPARAPPRADRR